MKKKSNGAPRRALQIPLLRQPSIICWSLAVAFVSLILILCRVLPIGGPGIFSDEYSYASWVSSFFHGIKTQPPYAALVGDWLYLRLYEMTFVGAGSFLIKARVLNAAISALGAGMLAITLHLADTSRQKLLAALLGTAFGVALLGTYAAYFMPDSPYFASVCLWLFVVVMYARSPHVWLALVVGALGGLATMIKVHGIFMLPATFVGFLIIGLRHRRGWSRILADCVFLIAGWFACTSLVEFFLGIGGSFDPIGSFYSGMGTHVTAHLATYSRTEMLVLLANHTATLMLIIGLPLLLCAWLGLTALFRSMQKGYPSTLQYPALILSFAFVGMLLITVIFTVAWAGTGIAQTLTRLYGRYYEHFAMLAACFGIIGSARILANWKCVVRVTILALFLVLLAAAWRWSLAVGWQNPGDFAMAYGLYALPAGREYAFVITGAGAVIAMLWPRYAPLALTCALLTWCGINVVATEKVRWPIQEQAAGRVAAMVAEDTSDAQGTTVQIVGPGETIPVFRAAFHLLNDQIHFTLGADADQCGGDGKRPDWVVTTDGASDPCGYVDSIRIGKAAAGRLGLKTSTEAVIPPAGKRRYAAKLALAGQSEVGANGRYIRVRVSVTNTGNTPYGSSTEPHNVNLGAHSINTVGGIVVNDLARGHLPQIAPGSTVQTSILLPINEILGHRVELLPVEENVAWFDKWGTKPLIIGPFLACSHPGTDDVCDKEGKPLLTATIAD